MAWFSLTSTELYLFNKLAKTTSNFLTSWWRMQHTGNFWMIFLREWTWRALIKQTTCTLICSTTKELLIPAIMTRIIRYMIPSMQRFTEKLKTIQRGTLYRSLLSSIKRIFYGSWYTENRWDKPSDCEIEQKRTKGVSSKILRSTSSSQSL